MGVFGVQVVVTMIVASFLHKLSPYYSLGRWLLVSGMRRYVPPRDSQLQHLVNAPGGRSSGAGTGKKNGRSDDHKPLDPNLTVSKSSLMKLTSIPVLSFDLLQVTYYQEFRWMMDISVAALTVYASTTIYYSWRTAAVITEYNLSVVWLIFLLLFALSLLFSLTRVYFNEQLSRERSLIIVFTTLFFVFALGILLIDEDTLQFRLRESHTNITNCVGKLLRAYIIDIDHFVLLPVWAFKMVLAVLASLLSAMLVYPSFRYSELQFNVLTVTRSTMTRALVRLCYLMPIFCLGLWIKPFSKDLFSEVDIINLLGREVYHETFRHWSILFYCGLKTALFKLHLQNYLELASLRVDDLRRESGRITILELRKKVSAIFSFYGGVSLQYMGPVLVVLSLSVLMHLSSPYQRQRLTPEQLEIDPNSNIFRSSGFGLELFHGCLSYLCWWSCFTIFVSSGFGSALRAYL